MLGTIYIETTIPSYYVARPSRDIIQLARQKLTRKWWDESRGSYQLYTSQVVLEEAGEGEPLKARERLEMLAGVGLLDIDHEVIELGADLIRTGILPSMAAQDALHIACAGIHRVNFVLTWNCKHIANPHLRERLRACFLRQGIDLPIICTPEVFLQEEPNDET